MKDKIKLLDFFSFSRAIDIESADIYFNTSYQRHSINIKVISFSFLYILSISVYFFKMYNTLIITNLIQLSHLKT